MIITIIIIIIQHIEDADTQLTMIVTVIIVIVHWRTSIDVAKRDNTLACLQIHTTHVSNRVLKSFKK